jgi:hypothetical protein
MTKSNPASVYRKLLKSLAASVHASVHASVCVGPNKPLKRLARRFCVGCVGGPPIPLYAARPSGSARLRNEWRCAVLSAPHHPFKRLHKTTCFGEINTSVSRLADISCAKTHTPRPERQEFSTVFSVRSLFALKRRIF